MDTTKTIGVGIALVIFAAIAWYALAGQADKDAMMQKDDVVMEDIATSESDAMMKDETDTTKDNSMMEPEKGAMMEKGTYEAYSPEKLALAASGDVLLFFHAPWCPICRTIEAEIRAGSIPSGVHILKVDFDTATALRQQYGVTVQHTFVQVNASGKATQKFSDAGSLSAALARIK